MGFDHAHGATHDSSSLAAALEPALRHACDGRLSEISWFRSHWQHGGAATGFAQWHSDDGHDGGRAAPARVMVKLPVGPGEHRWTTDLATLAGDDPRACTPRVFAGGREVGGHELCWLVVEALDPTPLHLERSAAEVETLIRAAADFHALARRARTVDGPAPREDWEVLIGRARQAAHSPALPHHQRWNDVLKKVQKHAHALAARWESRPRSCWCHGDLHAANALHRLRPCDNGGPPRPDESCCVLIDLALVHPGHWVEDMVYLERQHWSRPETLHGVKPVSAMARLRRERGLPAEDHAELADLRRVLMAATAPAFAAREGSARYLDAALHVLEQALPRVAR
jgi:aminoglycoside phosphotransferase (APT) family kinase protein